MKDGKLEITDAPMFGRVMRDEGICKAVLECILGVMFQKVCSLGLFTACIR